MEKATRWLYKALRYRFDDTSLFNQAMTHRSSAGRNNERLEFLGDAVLGFLISEALYRARPDAPEGELSKLRSSLVRSATLAELASDLGLGEYLILGSGEQKSGGHRRQSILADTLEALFGAIFLDGGIEAARAVIARIFAARLENLPAGDELRDPKTRLQEWLQARGMDLPVYDLLGVSGKAHQQKFEISCSVAEADELTRGESTTRRKAEQKAAAMMLTRLRDSNQ